MEEWKECKLGDVLNFRRGHDLPHSKMKNGNVPVAGSNGIIGYHDEATPISPCITIGRSGNVGTPYIYEQCWAHNTVLYVDDFKNNYPLYLYYLLKTLPLSSFGGGSAVPTLNRNHIHPLIIKHTPNINTQKKIASILKSLDDKIEVNRRINENLEQQAQALFKSWFVDFEPFKDQPFVESELGMIPQGWKVGTFLDNINVMPGGTPSTSIDEYWKDGNIPFFCPKDANGVYCFDTEKKITEEGLKKCSSHLYPKDTLFITARGTVGKLALAGVPMAMNQSNYALVAKGSIGSFYLYLLTQSLVSILMKKANGAVFSAITTRDFNEPTLMPPTYILNKFETIVTPLFYKIHQVVKESRHLAELRDTLLPRLMSGELRVTDVDLVNKLTENNIL